MPHLPPACLHHAFLSTTPDWPAGVQAVFTTRQDGHSLPPYDSWNLGDHVGDAPEQVAANRRLLAERTGAQPVFLNQVHGCEVVELRADTPHGTVADACWTAVPGLACTAMVADCLPLLFSAADGSSVAAVHAGWRGLLGQGGRGVIEALCQHWPAAQSAQDRANVQVWLGPCIGPTVFEVGPEVRDAFVAVNASAAQGFVPSPGAAHPGKFLANLPWLARQRLAALGIGRITGNDGSAAWCTVQQASRFFSHRRDAARLGSTGRMAAVIWRSGGDAV